VFAGNSVGCPWEKRLDLRDRPPGDNRQRPAASIPQPCDVLHQPARHAHLVRRRRDIHERPVEIQQKRRVCYADSFHVGESPLPLPGSRAQQIKVSCFISSEKKTFFL
jgi:hypothetical protein